jgi:hypothetical protein
MKAGTKLTRGGLFMNGRDVLFSAFKAVDLTTLVVGAKAAADPARRERAANFIMVATSERMFWFCHFGPAKQEAQGMLGFNTPTL